MIAFLCDVIPSRMLADVSVNPGIIAALVGPAVVLVGMGWCALVRRHFWEDYLARKRLQNRPLPRDWLDCHGDDR